MKTTMIFPVRTAVVLLLAACIPAVVHAAAAPARPNLVFRFGDAKENDARHPKPNEVGNFGTERPKCVLHNSRDRSNRLRLSDSFTHE